MKKKGYLTSLSTDSYLMGVLVLNQSLKNIGAMYPLCCLVPDNLRSNTYEILEKAGIEYIKRCPEFTLDANVQKENVKQDNKNWTHTFFKIYVLDAPFEKVVYLDADTFVTQNIDELFDKPHLTACRDYDLYPPPHGGYTGFNSGVMVINPNKEDFVKAVQLTNKWHDGGGDQQIFEQLYPDWCKHPELRLPKFYNVFGATYWVDFCFKDVSLKGGNAIRVVHMTGLKPWVDVGEKSRWVNAQMSQPARTFERQRYIYCLEKYRGYEISVLEFLSCNKLIISTK